MSDRRKEATRLEIAEAGRRLFVQDGYDRVSPEAIASAAGVSLRSFYRYFSSKEEVLSPLIRAGTADFGRLIAARSPSEDLVTAVERAYTALTAGTERGGVTGVIALLLDVPVLRARWLDDLRSIEDALVPVVQGRSPLPLSADKARLTTAAIVTAVRISLEAAVREGSDEVIATHLGANLRYLLAGAGLGP